ncbi:amidohydrolase [Gramella sp. MT6]|uniref:amidohydrolase n=1 Tax=Gramella sp. MT6 TaxID=2705471 RepID=UPI001C5E465F|nr:amidohydrolase [Gramella sp. MT6]QYA26942.1 amidohydrolase [Gramella sp. MT6]
MKITLAFLALLVYCLPFLNLLNAQESNTRVTIFHSGDIITMAGDLPSYAEALVINGEIITYVGNLNGAKENAGNDFLEVDLKGKTLLPGLIDGHAHFSNFASQAIGAILLPSPDADADNIPKIIEILKKWDTPENRELTGWIFGTGFDDSVLEEKRFPTKHDLDKVTTEYPIMITHISGHFAVVNSKGLEKLGITAATENPEGGLIRREKDSNEPNGVLEELAAIPFMLDAIAPKSPEANFKFFEAGQEMALSYGYTTAQEGRTMQNADYLIEMAEAGNLKLDVVSYVDYLFTDKYLTTKWYDRDYNNHFRFGGMKLTLDGSPQGRTAWRTEPYLIPPDGAEKDYSGYPAIPNDEDVSTLYRKALENNWQTLTHANGDAAMDQMIRTLKPLLKEYGNEERRFVLIHGQYVRDDQLDDFSEMRVIGSLFPLHTFYWGDWHKQIIGNELGNKISPMRTALDKGMKVTVHSDAPVALPNLMRVVWTAVERTSRSGTIIGENERLTPYEALKAITAWSAYQHFEEDRKGTLEVGKLADLVILDNNPLKVQKDKIKDIVVLETIKNGVSVYQK